MISARVKTDKLRDTLLLIDEPDTSLHPSGARYLRDELIRISNANYVIYSTHSIFMIDKEKIERHLIVTKEDEITLVKPADESNVVDEEVIYNALGYSIFESLKKKNIVFEGWRDKKLFQVATSNLPSEHKTLKKVLEKVGTCHARGVKDIQHITPLLELANRECFILSDDDAPAKEKQKEFAKSKGYGTWKRYSEISQETEAITGEDFIKPQAFRKSINSVRAKYPELPELSDSDLIGQKGKLHYLRQWLSKASIAPQDRESILAAIKEGIFEELKPSHIEPSYYELLEKLAELL